MANELQLVGNEIYAMQTQFNTVLSDAQLNFEAEAGFAIQLMQANDYLMRVALSNTASLRNAVTNIGAIGISLNPAKKQAYLVPRDGKICLDVSYRGMLHLAQQTGAIQWGQAKIVRLHDEFELMGIDQAPVHKYKAFDPEEARGGIVGAYVVIKTDGGDFLTHAMPIADIYKIRAGSAAWKAWESKKAKCPWVTHEEAMILKTVVKQAATFWPYRDRLQLAVHHADTEGGEGFDSAQNITPCDEAQTTVLSALLERLGRTWDQLASVYAKGIYISKPMSDMSFDDAETCIKFVSQKLKEREDAKNNAAA
jgi:recombination protein RecT